jgi:hypothetical protein
LPAETPAPIRNCFGGVSRRIANDVWSRQPTLDWKLTIFYLDTKGVLTAVSIIPGSTFSRGTPQPLFPVRARAPLSNTDVFSYDVVKDGS